MARKRKDPDPPPAAPPPWPERLRALRSRLGLTQQQAAARIRVSLRAWSGWERGEDTPSPPFELLLELLEAEKI